MTQMRSDGSPDVRPGGASLSLLRPAVGRPGDVSFGLWGRSGIPPLVSHCLGPINRLPEKSEPSVLLRVSVPGTASSPVNHPLMLTLHLHARIPAGLP
ncbi:hypothetical protein AAFF_G00093880 [Aldrovandia affinis]|uniref:Uncharacterized protein n=1 Tax=Aldrovandia affinis TaxID=143900 RepID=A0AAD7T413_9TELE|nr:hypothetical protein AAFF_G00093880 [Aldrovandia affinis]